MKRYCHSESPGPYQQPWEPEPLHLPLDIPRRRDNGADSDREPERERRVIIIDLA